MAEFGDELRAGIEEAARHISRALAVGDDYGAEAYRERLCAIRRVVPAPRHPATRLPATRRPQRRRPGPA